MIPTSTNVSVSVASKLPGSLDAIAILLHKQVDSNGAQLQQLPAELREAVEKLMAAKLVTGKSNELTVHLLDGTPVRQLLVVGLGNSREFSGECLREAGGVIARAARKYKLKRVALVVPPLPESLPGAPDAPAAGAGVDVGMDALATGLMLTSFDWNEYRGTVTAKTHQRGETAFTLIVREADLVSARAAGERAVVIAEGQNFARTIASRPGNEVNPPALAEIARAMAKEVGLTCRVLDEKEMKKLGMGGILAVGAGANRTPPRMIVMEHKGEGARGEGRGEPGRRETKGQGVRGKGRGEEGKKHSGSKSRPLLLAPDPSPLLIVGKAITFDTGGISIKPADKMGRMVFDKCGAMAVLGLMYAAAKLNLPGHIVGILASAENHISETAYRPGDLLRMYNGVTVEVTNTDAEGRLVLGDALAWGIEQFKPAAVVDLATLTGGCVVALGTIWAGLMSNSDALSKEITRSADDAGEKVWRLPQSQEVRDMLKSDFADIINAAGRWASPLTGGAFLSYFIPEDGKTPWVHLDIAGVAETEKDMPYYGKGATGWGVRTLVNWVSWRAGARGVDTPQSASDPREEDEDRRSRVVDRKMGRRSKSKTRKTR